MTDIKTANWYPALLDDLLSTYVETQFTAREAAIQRYHHWGHSISQVIESWGDLKYTANQLYDQLAADFEARKKRSVSKRSFYYALKFYQTFPKLEDFLAGQGKDLSWHKIVRQHLTESLSPLSDGSAQEEKEVSAPGLAQFISTKEMLEAFDFLMQTVTRNFWEDYPKLRGQCQAIRTLILDYSRLKKMGEKMGDRPTIVCLCGSTRFMDAFFDAGWAETLAGKIVLSVGVCKHADDHGGEALGPEVVRLLDELHLRKIDLADEVLILNVGGYIGESTRNELNYAREKGRRIRFLEPEKEPADD